MDNLYQRCERIALSVPIPTPFDIRKLCDSVGSSRDRPIHLLPVTLLPDALSGAWISAKRADYIVYQAATSTLHQKHIVLHEIGHLLCAHETAEVLDSDWPLRLLPSLDPAMVRRVLGRTYYSSQEEQEAEIIASLILQRAERSTAALEATLPDSPATVVERIEYSLGRLRRGFT